MTAGTALTEATFDEFVLAADVPVLIDFWAEWCGPCTMFDPILTALAADDHRFVLASVDIDSNPNLAMRFGVMSAPTLVLHRDGDTVWHSVGARSRSRLSGELEPFLSPAAAS